MVIKTKPTAYSKVALNLFQGIRGRHQVAHTPMLRSNRLGLFVYNNLLVYPSGDDEFAEDVIENNSYHFNADAVLTLKDLFAFKDLMQMPLEVIAYTPVDHSPVSPGITSRAKFVFKVVSMSKFGYDELRKEGIESTLIEHGIGEEYQPHEDRDMCRRTFHIGKEEVVIGFVGKNQVRKMIPRFFEVLKATREMNPDINITSLIWTDVEKEIPLKPVMMELGLNPYIHWPGPEMYRHGLTEELMVRLYNAFDCTVCVSGEGYWMPGLESLACGVPIVVPDYASAPDRLGRGCGYKVKVEDWTWNNPVGVRQPLVDVVDAAKKITKIINGDPEKYRKNAVRHAQKYLWSRIIEEKWIPFLDQCEEELRPMLKNGKILKWDQEVS